MGNKILISVLVPTYNRTGYLKDCIDSILSQKGFNNGKLELIISDNSDNNDSKNLIRKYITNNIDKTIIYNKNDVNLGMVGNWNKLLELKSGKYFIFLSDDDKFYDGNSLKKLYDNLIKYKLDAIFGISRNINDKGNFIHTNEINKINLNEKTPINIKIITKKHLIFQGGMGFGGILYKNSKILFDPKAGPGADAEFNISYSISHKIGLINKTIFLYRIHLNNESKKINFDEFNNYILLKHGINKKKLKFIYLQSKLREKFIKYGIKISLKLGIYGKMYDLYRKIF